MLNFDPHRWLAEREGAESVATVATVARVRADFKRSLSQESAATLATTATNPLGNPSVTLREGHSHPAPLDLDSAPSGFTLNRWQELRGDSWWIYENFASRALRDGWSVHDLFGVLPSRLGWGGMCDRLRGARNLKMDGDRTVWSRFGVKDWTCRGAGDDLVNAGLVLIWEIGR